MTTIQIERGKVLPVERAVQRKRLLPGGGLLESMAVIWTHWRESFRKPRDLSDIHGTFTQQYPEERPRLPEAYRNMPILLYDDATGHELCTSCFQCQRICPPQVIHMTQAKDPATGKAVPAVAEFVIEYDACMSCGFCAEICPFDAIKMDHAFELSTADHQGLTIHKAELNRPISYYEQMAPSLWAEARDGALKKLQANIKRRPDVIGMAPQLTERIAARRRELAAQAPPAAPPTEAPPAPPAKLSAEEKAAKLAAIKAANAAKAAAAEPPAAPPPTPADEKAARLAAIRAKNAAKAVDTEPPAAPPTPADEKAARLAAIRAKNAAKSADTEPQATPPPTPANEKAARLAAIRAKNAAKAAGENPEGESKPS